VAWTQERGTGETWHGRLAQLVASGFLLDTASCFVIELLFVISTPPEKKEPWAG
jgi:hypothetical protein